MVRFSIDIGGTKLVFGAFRDGQTHPFITHVLPLENGRECVVASVMALWARGTAECDSADVLPCLYLGCPGTWDKDYILPGTANNLASFPGEMDFFHLPQALLLELPPGWDVRVQNDAWCQAKGGILLSPQSGDFQRWCYVGPGTGLGGAVFDFSGHVFTLLDQGSWSELWLDILPEDRFFKEYQRNGLVNAELVLSGGGLSSVFGLSPLEMSRSPFFHDQYGPLISVMSGYLVQLFRLLVNRFSPDVFLVGGSLGTKAPFSTLLVDPVLAEFSFLPIERIKNTEEAALFGAFF